MIEAGVSALEKMGLWPLVEKQETLRLNKQDIYVDRVFAARMDNSDSEGGPLYLPQPRFLEAVVEAADAFDEFTFRRSVAITDVVRSEGRIVGVVGSSKGRETAYEGDLVIAADGRYSRLRKLAGLEPLRAELRRVETAQSALAQMRSEVAVLEQRRSDLQHQLVDVDRISKEHAELRAHLDLLRRQVVETEETVILQEVGLYRYRHPLDDAIAYKARLTGLQSQIKDSARAGNAVVGSTNWTVNGSPTRGAKMVKDFSKLMLRAYNAEADNAVRTMKPYTLESAIARLEKARDTIVKLGGTMNIRVTDRYHNLRVTELELTADYLAKAAEEKEHERAERERLRDEERARREIEREQDRLRKEQKHYLTVLATYQAQGNEAATADAQAKLNEIADGLDGLNQRAANIRAGYVYVISNVGAFGPNMVKVGMTRRLDPMDRVRELGDASVPFRYDIHALVFSQDAVGLETHLHHYLAGQRVNMVNARREFLYATPAQVRDILAVLDVPLLTFVDEPEALEWRQSETARKSVPEGLTISGSYNGPDQGTTADWSDVESK